VRPLTLAALAVGADGVMIEMHPEPEKALCDGPQSLRPEEFYQLMEEVKHLQQALRRGPGRRS
jgi:3-deoxy-7-phosphoheptulonate synthase